MPADSHLGETRAPRNPAPVSSIPASPSSSAAVTHPAPQLFGIPPETSFHRGRNGGMFESVIPITNHLEPPSMLSNSNEAISTLLFSGVKLAIQTPTLSMSPLFPRHATCIR